MINSKIVRKGILIIFLFMPFLFSAISLAQSVYFPQIAGSEWKYSEEKMGRIQTITLGMDKVWHNFFFHGESIKNDNAFPEKYYLLNSLLNSTWLIPEKPNIPCFSASLAECVSRNRTIETIAGKFYNCVVISYKGKCADTGIVEETFSPGIGLVQRKTESIMGEITWNLISCQVGGQEYPQKSKISKEKGVKFTAEINPMSAKRGFTAIIIDVHAQMINNSDESISLLFKQEPYLTAKILNDAENEVISPQIQIPSIFSKAKTINITSGQKKNFSTKLSISPSKLPLGRYSIIVELSSEPKFSATLPFKIVP